MLKINEFTLKQSVHINEMLLFVAYFVLLIFVPQGTALQRSGSQCSEMNANGCEDRPVCPKTSCTCIFASKLDCAAYYICINRNIYQYRCSPGLVFNPNTLTCDYTTNVNCSINATTGTSPSTETTTSSEYTPTATSTESKFRIITSTSPTEHNKIVTTDTTEAELTTGKNEITSSREFTPTTSSIDSVSTILTTNQPEDENITMVSTVVNTETTNSKPSTAEKKEITTSSEFTPTTTSIDSVSTILTTNQPKDENITLISTIMITETTNSELFTAEKTEMTTSSELIPTTGSIASKSTILTTTPQPENNNITLVSSSMNTDTNNISDDSITITSETTTTEIVSHTTENTTVSKPYSSTIQPSNFTCPSRFGLFPDPRNCSRFYHCSHEIPYHKECPSILHFNPVLKVCDWPSAAGCENTTPSKPYSSTTQPSDFACPSTFGLFPDPRNCSRFYHCSHETPYHKWCPSNLHFNPVLKVCDWPSAAGCDIVQSTTSVTESISSTHSPDVTISKCDCDYCELPNPHDCSSYIRCINKVAFQMKCSCDLYFNPMTGTCDLKQNVQCGNGSVRCPEASGRFLYPGSCSYFTECKNGEGLVRKCPEGLNFNKSSEVCSWTGSCTDETSDHIPTSKTILDITICKGCNYCFKLDASDCSRYVKCSNNMATQESCPAGLLFNPSTELCDHDYNVNCSRSLPMPSCSESFGYFPYPGNCGMFLQCINGNATAKRCPDLLHFNAQKKHCDWPRVAGCGGVSDLTPTPASETETIACDCECCLKSVVNDCKSFILCINQVGVKRSCSSGLLYNPQTENCDFPKNVNCTSNPNEEIYKCVEEQGLFPHPDDCQKFIHCSHGYPHVKSCPSNLHFNPMLNVCDWPYSAGCQGFSTLEPLVDNLNVACNVCDSCFVPVENDCAAYIYCVNSTGYKLRCTGNLLFNPQTKSCDNASNVQCPNQPNSPCPNPDGLFPAENCAQFIHCSNGVASLKDCPDGLHFNMQKLVCDWPVNSKCS